MRAERVKTVVMAVVVALCCGGGAFAQETVTPITAVQGDRGPVTNLPMPRYVSLKANEANVRRGPSLSHRIDWVFQRRNMPLRVIGEYGHWRRVVDREGMGGWVHYSLLSGNRTVIIDQDMLTLRQRPEAQGMEIAHLELGVIADLGECGPEWCRLRAGGYRGWAQKTALFGVAPDELRD
jgi:SH3-like domain-containing protein